MKLFISWSGEASKTVANTLREWIPSIIQDVQPWISNEDIAKGAIWIKELLQELHDARFGVICLTPENVAQPWILFEAGALSKAIDKVEVRVAPYLWGLEEADLRPPLSAFHATKANRADTLKLVRSINSAVEDSGGLALTPEKIDQAFNMWWPVLEKKLADIPVTSANTQKRRDDRDILEEILELVRSLSRSQVHIDAVKQFQENLHRAAERNRELILSNKTLKEILENAGKLQNDPKKEN